MFGLSNRFALCGNLKEWKLIIKDEYINIKFTIQTANSNVYELTEYYSKKYNENDYIQLKEQTNKLEFDTIVLAAGNISPLGNSVRLNSKYFKIVDNDFIINPFFELSVQWITNETALNVIDGAPKVFILDKPPKCHIGQIYKLRINITDGFILNNDDIFTQEKNEHIKIKSFKPIGMSLSNDLIKDLVWEWECTKE